MLLLPLYTKYVLRFGTCHRFGKLCSPWLTRYRVRYKIALQNSIMACYRMMTSYLLLLLLLLLYVCVPLSSDLCCPSTTTTYSASKYYISHIVYIWIPVIASYLVHHKALGRQHTGRRLVVVPKRTYGHYVAGALV